MSDWIAYADQKPGTAGAYHWKLPSVGVPGLVVTFIAHMRTRGAGYENVLSPLFDYWDGYRVILPQGIQWQPAAESEVVKWHEYGGVRAEGVDPCACPYCEKVPILKGAKRYNDGTMSHGASPHEYSSWWLECCAWARTPQYKDPRDLVARRDSVVLRSAPASGWIKCSEVLPELPKGGGKHHVMAYTPAREAQRFAKGSRFLYWNGIDWRYPDGSRFEHRVTHWQPFLAPPTE